MKECIANFPVYTNTSELNLALDRAGSSILRQVGRGWEAGTAADILPNPPPPKENLHKIEKYLIGGEDALGAPKFHQCSQNVVILLHHVTLGEHGKRLHGMHE